MTRAVRNGILKDANGDIGDHLRNHIHLTNCIHLKNHMHKHSPLLHDRSFMRDLIVLQRSRSLRDPSASPPLRHSPIIADLLSKDGERVGNGRSSFGVDHQQDGGRYSGSSPPLENLDEAFSNELGCKSGPRDIRKSVMSSGNQGSQFDETRKELSQGASGNSERRCKKSIGKGKYNSEVNPKSLSQQLSEIPIDSDGVFLSNRPEKATEEAEPSASAPCCDFSKVKQRKLRQVRRAPGSTAPRGNRVVNEISVASNSSVKGIVQQRHPVEDREDEFDKLNVSRTRNGCGIPFNWSQIHHRGKTFLDKAGRSLSCGLSDPRSKGEGEVPHGRDNSDFSQTLEQSSSCTKSDVEALPLLVDGSGSQASSDHVAWAHDYSGELGIFADSLLKHHIDSDLASEVGSGDRLNSRQEHRGRHQSLTQRYMPRTFRDLVGQNLVAQALSNAVIRRKVGLLYVFYGPHGTGKTSSARIFARALNCQSPEHPKPCGFCCSCVAHDTGKSRNIKEVGPINNFDYETIINLLDSMVISQQTSQYKVFIFDDSDTLSPDCWSAILKVIDRAPRRMIFVLICSSLDVLPHVIISRCQKFFFPKLKDADIIYALQWIATKEGIEIDKDALRLIASRSDGSLRDAEMTLEQLSLLGQNVTVTLVQELVGLISDEKLVDLLDLALSADTVNTVKKLREVMESGVEPLALMSQLATAITDVLAGSYDFTKERGRRKFFRQQSLSKEDMERLRQALKTLSEAEKQLRMSNDKLTWLTAALLQLAPDQLYMLPSSSAEEASFNHWPLALDEVEHVTILSNGRRLSTDVGVERHHAGSPSGSKISNCNKQVGRISWHETSGYGHVANGKQVRGKGRTEIEDIWLEVLDNIQISCVKEFMYQEGKLMSVSYGAAPTVRLLFTSPQTKSKAEKFRAYILRAFECVLGSPVTIEIRCESRKDIRGGSHAPLVLPTSDNGSTQMSLFRKTGYRGSSKMSLNQDYPRSTEIIEEEPSPREWRFGDHSDKRGSNKRSGSSSALEGGRFGEQNQCRSLVRGKVSLAHVIQQAEGSPQRSGWTKSKAVTIAEKLEQENLRLEPRSRNLLCWKASRTTRQKISRLKFRSHMPHTLLKLVSCGKCMSSTSPR